MSKLRVTLAIIVIFSLLLSLLASCTSATPTSTPTAQPSPIETTTPTLEPSPTSTPTPTSTATQTGVPAYQAAFGEYIPVDASVTPSLAPYKVPANLAGVSGADKFDLSDNEINALVENGFFVRPADHREFYQLYEDLRYGEKPAFVTTDSALHAYHLLFDKLLRSAEREEFVPALKEFTQALLDESLTDYKNLRVTNMENAALRNVAFFAVAAKLLKMDIRLPEEAEQLVADELALIEAHEGMINSPIFGYEEDYTQYIPRGHYTKSTDLEDYFRTMMWYGRMTFRLKSDNPQSGREETKSALLITKGIESAYQGKAAENWKLIYDPTSFFVGTSDDLTYYDYLKLIDDIYGSDVADEQLGDEEKLSQFIEKAFSVRPPKINSMVLYQWQDLDENIRGFRVMGQRFVIDAGIFQQLVHRVVKDRMLPNGLDIPAALGSGEAYSILDSQGETKYENYRTQMEKVQQGILELQPSDWRTTLYSAWIDTLRPLLDEPGQGYPTFMQNKAWVRKSLATFTGSWAELKHDTILYAKQVYAERGGGPSDAARGYVEPEPEVFARLAALSRMTGDGLTRRGLINDDDRTALNNLTANLMLFTSAAKKELTGEALSVDEYSAIENWGATLEHVTIQSADPPEGDQTARKFIESLDAAVIADVATDPNGGRVLEVGVGRVYDIFVVVPDGDGLKLTQGGVFSYYEFPQPLNGRLTDEKWRETLDSSPPVQPSWTESFTVK